MKNYIFEATASSKRKAINEILENLDISKDLLDFQISGDASNIIASVFSKDPVVVKAYVKQTEMFPIEKIVKGVLLTLLKKMSLKAKIINITNLKDQIYVELDSEEVDLIIGKDGKKIENLQFIINSMIFPKYRKGRRIILDIASYRDRRKLIITKIAKNMTEIVARKKIRKKTELMNPTERKIFHTTVEKEGKATTKSEGHGLYKRINVFPIRKKPKIT